MGSINYGFKEDDKLTGKDDFYVRKMILDLKLEDQEVKSKNLHPLLL